MRGHQGWAEGKQESAFGEIRASVWDENQVLGIVVTAGQQGDVINAPRMYSEKWHITLYATRTLSQLQNINNVIYQGATELYISNG